MFDASGQYVPQRSLSYRSNGVNFTGATPDYWTRDADMTGHSDGKLLTGSLWTKFASDGVVMRIFTGVTSLAGNVRTYAIGKLASNKIQVLGYNAAAAKILDIRATTATAASAGWTHHMFSADLGNAAEHLYRDDVSDLTSNTLTDDSIDFTGGDLGIGARPDASQPMNGDIADLMVWPGVYLDLSVQDNRRLFIDADGKPVNPAVAVASLGNPILMFHGKTDGIVSAHLNKGSGGGMTINGAPSASSTSPSD